MAWLQFFDEDGNVLQEFQQSKQAKLFMDKSGLMCLDEFAADTAINPRVLIVPAGFAYAKSISEDGRERILESEGKTSGGENLPITELRPPGEPQNG